MTNLAKWLVCAARVSKRFIMCSTLFLSVAASMPIIFATASVFVLLWPSVALVDLW